MDSQAGHLIREEVIRGSAQWNSIISAPTTRSPFRPFHYVILAVASISTAFTLIQVFTHKDCYTATSRVLILTKAPFSRSSRIEEELAELQHGVYAGRIQLIDLSIVMPVSVSQRIHPKNHLSLSFFPEQKTPPLKMEGILIGMTQGREDNTRAKTANHRMILRSIVVAAIVPKAMVRSQIFQLNQKPIQATFQLD